MMLSKKVDQITKQDILDRIGSEAIYRAEIADMKIGRAMCNPLRKDRNPSFCLFIGSDGHVHHIDYADDRYKGGCIELVMQKYNLRWRDAIQKIAADWGLLNGTYVPKKAEVAENRQIEAVKKHSMIQILTRLWNPKDIDYWSQYGIMPHHLVREKVHPVKELYINRLKEKIGIDEIVYAYEYPGNGLKIYMPTREKQDKWKSNISTKTVEGLERLNGHQKVIVTKSLKDRLTLECILPPEIGIINTQNESISAWTEELLEVLQGRKVWISYDSDPPGKHASHRVNERYPWMKHVNVPDVYYQQYQIKDWADMMKVHGPQVIIEHMEKKKII